MIRVTEFQNIKPLHGQRNVSSNCLLEDNKLNMKFAVFLVLLSVCLVSSVKITNWGNVHGRTLGTENVVVKSSMLQVKTHQFTYPRVSWLRIHCPNDAWLIHLHYYRARDDSSSMEFSTWTTRATQFPLNSLKVSNSSGNQIPAFLTVNI